jgi:hypothetical protein
MNGKFNLLLFVLLSTAFFLQVNGQDILTLQEAIELGVKNYGTIKSKDFQVQSLNNALSQVRRDLPAQYCLISTNKFTGQLTARMVLPMVSAGLG